MGKWLRKSYDEPVDMLDVYYDQEVNGRTAKYIMSIFDNIYDEDEFKQAVADLQTALDNFNPEDQSAIIARLQEVDKDNVVKYLKYGW